MQIDGMTFFDMAENLAKHSKKIVVAELSLYIDKIDSIVKEFENYHEMKKYVLETIPSDGGFKAKGELSEKTNTLIIEAETEFDSGFGLEAKNCQIHIFNLKFSLIKQLAWNIECEFSYISINVKNVENVDELNELLIKSFTEGDSNTFMETLELGPDNLNEVMEMAEEKNNLAVIKVLFEHGADNFDHILIQATEHNHFDIADFMVVCGANIQESFQEACKTGLYNSIKVFLEHTPVNVNKGLYEASKNNKVDTIKILLQNGATDINGALRSACESGSINVVKFLLERGANHKYSLCDAAESYHVDCVELLLNHGIEDTFGVALKGASKKGYENVIELLLKRNKYHISDLNKALWQAIYEYNKDIAKILIEHGANNFGEILKMCKDRGWDDIISLIESKMSK